MSTSTANAALVDETNTVVNVIVVELDGSYEPPEGMTAYVLEAGSFVNVGWTFAAGEFTPPATPEPAGPPMPSLLDLQAQIDDLTDFIATNL